MPTRFDPIQWDGVPSNQHSVAIETFLRSEFPDADDRHQQPPFGFGFTSLRRHQCVKLFRKYKIHLSREDGPVSVLHGLLKNAWDEGRFGDPSVIARTANPHLREIDHINSRIDRLEGSINRIAVALGVDDDEPEDEPEAEPEDDEPEAEKDTTEATAPSSGKGRGRGRPKTEAGKEAA